MDPNHFRYGGGAEYSQILPLTAALIVIVGVLIVVSARKSIPLAFLSASLLLPFGQVLVVGGLHFMVFRLLIMLGWARVVFGGMHPGGAHTRFKANSIDRTVLWWTAASVVVFTLQYGTSDALINRLGEAYSIVGTYFLMRCLCCDAKDVERLIKCLAFICVLVAMFMVCEQYTGRNWFSIFGSAPEVTPVREGRIRSQGPFGHPITAGTFGATLLPLFVSLWWAKNGKAYTMCGLAGGVVMTYTCASATPWMSVGAGLIALFLWPVRRHMHLVRGGFVAIVVGLHLVMKAPVWALISRVDVIGGNSGDHRYELVNRTIIHFWDWWLLGTAGTERWGYLMHDTANAFVEVAVTGGLLGLSLFIGILVKCFRRIGLARKAAGSEWKRDRQLWAWGTWLFCNVVALFGITYFDQSLVAWYSLLAAVSAATAVHGNQVQPSIGLTVGGNDHSEQEPWAAHSSQSQGRTEFFPGRVAPRSGI